ncbi:hypothetical protein [Haloplanus rallus]|uniref:hypothetical protein n=1 Tax=Haloplanus rallus TaxID=1816183 RepID=UPI0018EE95B8|nr:hypothetical protein [Haloplanus rallus]
MRHRPDGSAGLPGSVLVSRDSNPARRTHTAFYDVLEADGEVRVIGIVDVDEAHKRYGFD